MTEKDIKYIIESQQQKTEPTITDIIFKTAIQYINKTIEKVKNKKITRF
jgi:hypothetical protein